MPATEQLAISFPEAVIVLVSDGDQEFFAHDKMDPWERGWTAGNILHIRTASDLSVNMADLIQPTSCYVGISVTSAKLASPNNWASSTHMHNTSSKCSSGFRHGIPWLRLPRNAYFSPQQEISASQGHQVISLLSIILCSIQVLVAK